MSPGCKTKFSDLSQSSMETSNQLPIFNPAPPKKTLGYGSNGSKLNWLVQEKERELHKFQNLCTRYRNNFNLRSLIKMTIRMMHKPTTTVPRLPSN
jgi:hypothetical protein